MALKVLAGCNPVLRVFLQCVCAAVILHFLVLPLHKEFSKGCCVEGTKGLCLGVRGKSRLPVAEES